MIKLYGSRISTRKYAVTSPCDENRSRSKITCNANEGIQSKCDATSIETRSDIVPPLDLQSEENYPLQGDYTFSYRKHCETTKIDRKPDLAYQTWLSAKR